LDHDAPWQHLLEDLYAAFSRSEVWKVFPDTVVTLSDLRERGLNLAVISNWDRRLPHILAGLDLDRFFSVVTVSSLEGVEKPAPEIFWRTARRLGVRPEETLHVGDSLREDYQGASHARCASLLVDRQRLFVGEGVRRVDSLVDVVALISDQGEVGCCTQ
jgi:putative hydrolase of the HAD superfamily